MTTSNDILKRLEETLARFTACTDPGEKFRLGLDWVDQLLAGGKFLEATEAAGILKPLAPGPLEQAQTFQRAGRAYLRLSDYDKARYYINEALARLGDHPDSMELSLVYHDMAWMQYRQGYPEKARSYAEDAELTLDSSRSANDPRREAVQAECHHLFSLIDSATGNYTQAVSRLEKEIAIRLVRDDEQRLAAAYNKLSSVLQTTGDIVGALEHQRRAMALAESTGNIFRRSISLKNFGELHFIIGDLDRAWRCHTDSLSLSVQAGNHLGFVFNHAGLGRIYRARGSAVSAMSEYSQALDAARRIKCRDRESSLLADMADLLCDGELWQEARERLDQARRLDNERGQDPSPWHVLVSARAAAGDGADGAREAARLVDSILSGPLVIDDEEFITIPELKMAALMLKGGIERKQGHGRQASERFSQARDLAREFCRGLTPEQKALFWKRREMAAIEGAAGGR